MSDANAMVAEVLKALVARNASKRAKGVLLPESPPQTETQAEDISEEEAALLAELAEGAETEA